MSLKGKLTALAGAFISNSSLFLPGFLPDDLAVWIYLSALPHGKESFCHFSLFWRMAHRLVHSYHPITTVLLTKRR